MAALSPEKRGSGNDKVIFSGRSSLPSLRGSSLRPRRDCGCPEKNTLSIPVLSPFPKYRKDSSRSFWLAETPPAMTMDFTSLYFALARDNFSRRMSTAVFWKLAAKSDFC